MSALTISCEAYRSTTITDVLQWIKACSSTIACCSKHMVIVCGISIQRLFLGMCVHSGLTIYGGDATDAYAHSPAPNNTYLSVDDAYAEWYKYVKGVAISKRQVLHIYHALQGHPESGKMWMKLIDNIIINELGFHTTTHDRCIYRRVQDRKT